MNPRQGIETKVQEALRLPYPDVGRKTVNPRQGIETMGKGGGGSKASIRSEDSESSSGD